MKDLFIISAAVFVLLSVGVLVYHFYLAPEAETESMEQSATNYAGNAPDNNQDKIDKESEPATGEGTIIESPSGSGPTEQEVTKPTKSVAHSQEDCATLSHNCGSCLEKSGCGWCKSTNSCLYGDSRGPRVSSCPSDQWAITSAECNVVEDDFDCYGITNCAECLSGSGCRWCIQGSICAPASSEATCFGGWLAESYQCNYASR